MAARHDALVNASRLVLGVQHMASGLEICRAGTVGNVQTYPNAVNVIPGLVAMGVEFQEVDMGALSSAEEEFRRLAAEVAVLDGATIDVKRLENTQSVPIKPRMQGIGSCRRRAHWTGSPAASQRRRPRCPGDGIHHRYRHDFVPSVDGVSHAPGEYSTHDDCANGAQVLMNLLLLAEDRL